jgi:hypothetical protein
VGAVTGAVFVPLLFAVGESTCEYECTDYNAGHYVAAGLGGAILLGGAGAIIGSVIGTALPGKNSASSSPPPEGEPSSVTSTPPPGPSPSTSRIGSLVLSLGVDALTDTLGRNDTGSGAGFRAALLAHFSNRWLSVGPEASLSGVGAGLFTLGGVVSVSPFHTRIQPYGVFDMGWYSWSGETNGAGWSVLGAGIGAGLAVPMGEGRRELRLESRYHWCLQNIDEPAEFNYVSLTAGLGFNW